MGKQISFEDLEKLLKEFFNYSEKDENQDENNVEETFDKCCVEKLKNQNRILSEKYNKLKVEYDSLRREYDKLSNDVNIVLDIIDLFIMFLDTTQSGSKKQMNFKASSNAVPFDMSDFLN